MSMHPMNINYLNDIICIIPTLCPSFTAVIYLFAMAFSHIWNVLWQHAWGLAFAKVAKKNNPQYSPILARPRLHGEFDWRGPHRYRWAMRCLPTLHCMNAQFNIFNCVKHVCAIYRSNICTAIFLNFIAVFGLRSWIGMSPHQRIWILFHSHGIGCAFVSKL